MLRTAQSLPLGRAFDAALRRQAFPPDAGSLLPGLLAATRTGLPPASDDEHEQQIDLYDTRSPPVPLGARKIEVNAEREIGAELDKERTEVGVHAVEVEGSSLDRVDLDP